MRLHRRLLKVSKCNGNFSLKVPSIQPIIEMTTVQTHAKSFKAPQLRRHRESQTAIDFLVFLIPFLQFARLGVFGVVYGAVLGVLNGTDISMLAVFCYLCLPREDSDSHADRQVVPHYMCGVACCTMRDRYRKAHCIH